MPALEVLTTVREIWHLALPDGTRLLGGEQGLDQRVEWAATLRAAYPLFGTMGPGYMALARLELARSLDARITPSYLINELHRVNASALVVDEPVSDEEAFVAETIGLPLLCLPAGSDLHETERAILRTLVDREAQLARREAEARQNLLRAFGRGGIETLLADLVGFTPGRIVVLDVNKNEIGSASNLERDASFVETAYPIRVAGRLLGQLVLSSPAVRKGPLDELYARQAAEICGIEMLQHVARLEAEERLGADLIEQLLDNERDNDAVLARFGRLGYDLGTSRRHIVLALASASGEDAGAACQTPARDLQWSAQRDGATVLSTRYRSYLLVLCSFAESVSERRVRQWLQEAFEQGGTLRCEAGVSRVAEGISGLRVAVRQAIDAWDLGQIIVDRQSPYHYEELGLYRLLAGLRGHDELKRFYEETVGPLARYDKQHNTDLVHTLDIFFQENTNVSQAARALYVHRNTLNYRLQRIVEITGLDLSDPEARLAFQLALKVYHISP